MNPVPEANWLYRRLLTFAVTVFVGMVVAYIAHALAAASATGSLLALAYALIIQATALQIFYIVAPTAEYMSKIAEVIRAARGDNA